LERQKKQLLRLLKFNMPALYSMMSDTSRKT
jgi:hypothetical protein